MNDSAMAYLAKIDLDGNIIWDLEFGQHNNSWTYVRHISENDDGTIILVGESDVSTGGGTNDVFIKKLSATGMVIWEKEYGGIYDDLGGLARPHPGGGYLVGGVWNRNGAGAIDDDIFLLKLDENGDQEWLQLYGTDFDDGGGVFTINSDTTHVIWPSAFSVKHVPRRVFG
ncbi:MAG: hypothetical protein ACI9J3_002563 [Parvicellaceae bacterium]|jgi:hypothetical protein